MKVIILIVISYMISGCDKVRVEQAIAAQAESPNVCVLINARWPTLYRCVDPLNRKVCYITSDGGIDCP